jgi:Ca2+-binding RTX toxin-like protein
MLGIDPATGEPVAEYVYLLQKPDVGNNVDKIGDAVYAGDGKFYVVERDSSTDPTAQKFVFEVSLTGATNVLGLDLGSETLEQQTPDDLEALGIQSVNKIKVTNLPSLGYEPTDKSEGLAYLPDGRLAVINDNDFGIVPELSAEQLGIIDFPAGNTLDASDEDGGINLQNWPVYGLKMPDGIATYNVNGINYFVIANEGDDRGEDVRVEDIVLDPTAFPNAAELQLPENLGRLSVSSIDGDLDGDGDYDQLFSYGGRGFSIYDELGNLVYDSGDDFETITAAQVPDLFNSNGEADSFDSRSDNKGPEAENVTLGQIGDTTYAYIGLERTGGVMVYDVTDPTAPQFVQYAPNPGGDVSPEGLTFIDGTDSPTGRPLLLTANEVSNTLTVYDVGSGVIQGSGDADELVGDASDNLISALAGDDVAAGELGNDAIFGGDGDDVLRGDRNARDAQVGEAGGDDLIYGGAGNDRIGGKSGNDVLFGDAGDDQIWGDDGDDILRGGLGNDTLTGDNNSGGQGSDVFVLAVGEGTDTITDFEVGIDFIGLAGGLSFGQLAFSGNAIAAAGEVLASLTGVDTTTLTADSFVTL